MRTLAPVAFMACALLAGCGGGGGGGPAPIRPGTFSAQASGAEAFTFNGNVMGAVASGPRVVIYADQRTGPVNAYTSSRRITITLNGPVLPGTYNVSPSGNAGTSQLLYTETVRRNDAYVTTGTWTATSGSVTVNVADGRHIEGSFSATVRNTATGNVITWQNGKFNVPYETPPSPPT